MKALNDKMSALQQFRALRQVHAQPQAQPQRMTQVESLIRQKKFAWAKVYETMGEEADRTVIIINHLFQRQDGEIVRPQVFPPHISNELFEMAEQLNKKYTCPICFELTTKETFTLTSCGHIICKGCRDELKENTPSGADIKCPTCRAVIDKKN